MAASYVIKAAGPATHSDAERWGSPQLGGESRLAGTHRDLRLKVLLRQARAVTKNTFAIVGRCGLGPRLVEGGGVVGVRTRLRPEGYWPQTAQVPASC